MASHAASLTGPSDLMVGLDRLGGDWHVVLMGRPSNTPAAMLDVCRTMVRGTEVAFFDFGEPAAQSALLDPEHVAAHLTRDSPVAWLVVP